jgi:hypothetical protein
MTEPMSAAGNAAAGAAGFTLALSGSIFGLHFDAMFAGFAAALIAQTFVPTEVTRMRGFLQLVAAGGLSGFFSPIGVEIVGKLTPWPLAPAALQLAVGATLGICAPIFIPMIRKAIEKFAGKQP